VLWSISKPTQATAHTCTLKKAMNLNIPKITKDSHPNVRNEFKINKHHNDSNILTHDIWSKPKLGMRHIHLELLWNLTYAITKKIKHISRINISDNYKIVISSPEVHFGIKRYHAEVGHKNLIIFSCNNHLDRFCRNGKQFL
jgi:hypothetical protein